MAPRRAGHLRAFNTGILMPKPSKRIYEESLDESVK
jgi:hypothetical protein